MDQQQAVSSSASVCLSQTPLSAEREWDTDKDAPTNARRKKGKQTKAVNDRKRERTRHERFLDVETFWRTTPPEKRQELLRVPMSALLEEANRRKEAGNSECVEDVIEGLVLLREQNNANARYWICPVCDQKFHTRRDYLHHVELFHEELALQDNKYVTCSCCQAEVVGMYYSSSKQPSYNLCVRCYGTEVHQAASLPRLPFEKVYPRSPSAARAWSETSDFISTRDSFSSLEDDYQQDVQGTLPPTRQLHPILVPPAAAEGSDEWSSAASGPTSQQGSIPRSPVSLPSRPAAVRTVPPAATEQLHPPSAAAPQSSSSSAQPPQPDGTVAAAADPSAAAASRPEATRSMDPASHGIAQFHILQGMQQRESVEHGAQPSAPCSIALGSIASEPQPVPCPPAPSGMQQPPPGPGSDKAWSWWPRRFMHWNLSSAPEGSTSRQGSLTQQHAPLYSPTASPPSTPPQQPPSRRAGMPQEHAPSLHSPGQHLLNATTAQAAAADASGAQGQEQLLRHAGETPMGLPQANHMAGAGMAPPFAQRLLVDPTAGDLGGVHLRDPGSANAGGSSEQASGSDAEAVAGMQRQAAGAATLAPSFGLLPMSFGFPAAAHLQAAGSSPGLQGSSDTSLLAMAAVAHAELVAAGSRPAGDLANAEQANGLIRDAMAHMVESVMKRMREMYGTDREVGDMSLGSITQFAFRKLCHLMDDPAASAARAALPSDPLQTRAVEEFVEQPSVVFQKPETLRAVLGCLSLADLQMVLAYVVRQHSDAMAQALRAGILHARGNAACTQQTPTDPHSSSTTAATAQTDAASSEGDSSGGEGGDDGSESADEGAATLFELRLRDEDAFDRMIEEVWGYPEPADGNGKAANSTLRKHYGEEVSVMLSGGYGLSTPSEPYLEPAAWWVEHLRERSATDEGGVAGELAALRWVYGNVVSVALEEFAERQRTLRNGRDRDSAVSELYEEVAMAWRSLQAATDHRNRLEELRKNARRQLALVRSLQEDGQHCSAEQAAEFLDALLSGYCSMQPGKAPTLYLCEAAVEVVRRHPQLAQDASQVYARALLDRELAVLALAEAMLAHQMQDMDKELQRSEEASKAARKDVKDLEAEYNKVAAEGPASHRKRDMLDKATKEAEHREKLSDLHARAHAAQERLVADETNRTNATNKRLALEAELRTVRDSLRSHALRKKSLDDVCAQLDAPMPAVGAGDTIPAVPGPGSVPENVAEGTDALPAASTSDNAAGGSPVDLNWRAQRLECLMLRVWWVSEAVKMFRDQYSPHAAGKQYELLIRATNWAKTLAAEYDATIKAQFAELDRLRTRVADVACVDQAHELHSCALEAMRRRIEAVAATAREEASMLLLRELEAEEAERRDSAANGGPGNASRKKAAPKAAAKPSKAAERPKRLESRSSEAHQEESRRLQEESERQAREEARRARETAIEAELEKRRLELEILAMRQAAQQAGSAKPASSTTVVLSASAPSPRKEVPAPIQEPQEVASVAKMHGSLISKEDFASESELDAATRAAIEASLRDLDRHGSLLQPDSSSATSGDTHTTVDSGSKANARRNGRAVSGASANSRRQRNRAGDNHRDAAGEASAAATDPDPSNAHTYVDRLLSDLTGLAVSQSQAATAPPPSPRASRQRGGAGGKGDSRRQAAAAQRATSEPERVPEPAGLAISLSDPDSWPSLAVAGAPPPTRLAGQPSLPRPSSMAPTEETSADAVASGTDTSLTVSGPPSPQRSPSSATQQDAAMQPAVAPSPQPLQAAAVDLPAFNPFAENPLQRALAREALSALDLAASPAREPRMSGLMSVLDLAGSPLRSGTGLFDRSNDSPHIKSIFSVLDQESAPRSPIVQPQGRQAAPPPSPVGSERPASSLGMPMSPARMLFGPESSGAFSSAPGTPPPMQQEQQQRSAHPGSLLYAPPSMRLGNGATLGMRVPPAAQTDEAAMQYAPPAGVPLFRMHSQDMGGLAAARSSVLLGSPAAPAASTAFSATSLPTVSMAFSAATAPVSSTGFAAGSQPQVSSSFSAGAAQHSSSAFSGTALPLGNSTFSMAGSSKPFSLAAPSLGGGAFSAMNQQTGSSAYSPAPQPPMSNAYAPPNQPASTDAFSATTQPIQLSSFSAPTQPRPAAAPSASTAQAAPGSAVAQRMLPRPSGQPSSGPVGAGPAAATHRVVAPSLPIAVPAAAPGKAAPQPLPTLPSSLGLDGPSPPQAQPSPLQQAMQHAGVHPPRPVGGFAQAPASFSPAPAAAAQQLGNPGPAAHPNGRSHAPVSKPNLPSFAPVPAVRPSTGASGGRGNSNGGAPRPRQTPTLVTQSSLQPSAAPFYPAPRQRAPAAASAGPVRPCGPGSAAEPAGQAAAASAQQDWNAQRPATAPSSRPGQHGWTPAGGDGPRPRSYMDLPHNLDVPSAMSKQAAVATGGRPDAAAGWPGAGGAPGLANGWVQQAPGGPGVLPLPRPAASQFVADNVNWSVNQPAGVWPGQEHLRWPGMQ